MRVSPLLCDLERIKRACGLASIATASGVDLRRTGRLLVGRCPFHDDRTPSFMVDERDDHYHCFGCGAHGDVVDFVRRRERLGFRQALDRLLGMPLRYSARPERYPARKGPARRVADPGRRAVLDAAAEWYAIQLWSEPAPLAYAAGRSLQRATLERFWVGYASGAGLADYLRWLDLSEEAARRVGLLRRDGGEPLGGRLTFPERRDAEVVWMMGRRLDDADDSAPKYRGLPGPKPLYGLETVRDRSRVCVVEGPIDRLVLWQWGVPAVALAGTRARPEVIDELARFDRVYLALDSDDAGQAATAALRGALGHRAVPVTLPAGCDPGDLAIQPSGRERFFAALDEAAASDAWGRVGS